MIKVDMIKARDIAHGFRRAKRQAEFAPLDIEATIPTKAAEAEAARQKLRDKYAAIQEAFDQAQTHEELAVLVRNMLP